MMWGKGQTGTGKRGGAQRLLLDLLVFLLGIAAAAALDRFIAKDLGFQAAVLTVLTVLAFAVVFLGQAQDDLLRATLTEMRGTASRSLETTRDQIDELTGAVAPFADRLGLSIDVQLTEELNAFSDPSAQDRVARVVSDAQSCVRMLDLIESPGHRADAIVNFDARRAYFRGLDELAQRTLQGFEYRRIVQTRDPNLPLHDVSDLAFLDHASTMAKTQSAKGSKCSIKASPVVFPYKFILIDTDTVVLQLQRQGDDGLDLDCEVVIVDPSGRLFRVFERMWLEIDDHVETRSLRGVEIEDTIQAASA